MKSSSIVFHVFPVALLALLVCAQHGTFAHEKPRPITVSEARELLQIALPPETLQLPGLYVDGAGEHDRNFPSFYVFNITWSGGEGTSAVVGFFDVDPATGDVFRATGCEQLITPKFKALQMSLWRKIGLSRALYNRIKRQGPYCS